MVMRKGGAVFADGNAHVTLVSSLIMQNSFTGGGVLLAADNASLMVVGPVLIADNDDGMPRTGVCEVRDQATLSLTGDVVFAGNHVGMNGSELMSYAIYAEGQSHLSVGQGALFEGRVLTRCSSEVVLDHQTCAVGEILANGGCQCCPPSTLGFAVNATTCLGCPANAVCPGGDVVWPVPGYWHSAARSVQLHKCPLYTKSCGERGVCQAGYTGNLCGACADGFGLTQPLTCGRCMPPGRQLTVYLLLFLACVGIIVYTVHVTWQDNEAGDSDLRPSDCIKVLVQFLQYLVILGSISVPWPGFITQCFATAAVVFSAAAGQSSLDCLLQQYGAGKTLPLAVQRQLVQLLLAPAAVLVAVMLMVLLGVVAKRAWLPATSSDASTCTPSWKQVPDKLRVAALVVAFFAYPTLVKAALSFFACLRIDDAHKQPHPEYAVRNHSAGYWVSDIQQECFAGWHGPWALGVGVPAALLLCVGVPATLLLFIGRNSASAKDPAFRKHYGFLYRNYRDGKLWWEAVWAVQTVLLTAVSVFHFSFKAYYSLLLMGLLLCVSSAVQLVAHPYIHQRLHRLHLASTCCVFVNVWLALGLFSFEFDAADLMHVHTSVGAAMLALNAAFLAWCVYRIVQLGHPAIVKAASAAWAQARGCMQRTDKGCDGNHTQSAV